MVGQVESFQPLSPLPIFYDTLYGFHAVDMLGNIVWICPLAPSTFADILIWDGYGPSRTRGDFFDSEVVGEEVGICALCCQKHTTTECGDCHLNYFAECIDPHTCGDKTVY